jgi:outer membrane protein assembly factor BamB
VNRTSWWILATLLCALPAGSQSAAVKSDWPQFRGPNRDGVSADTGLLKEWPSAGPTLLWEAKGAGIGFSSLAITGGRVYTVGDGPSTAEDKDEYVLCFEEAAGKQLWKSKIGPTFTDRSKDDRSGPRCTPTVDGELLYALTPQGVIVCLETAAGKERWRKDLKGDFGGNKADGWGYSESPLVDGDNVVCTPGGSRGTMVCLSKKTGATVWTAAVPEDAGAGHASIVISEVGKTKVYVQTTGNHAMGVKAADGKVLWTTVLKMEAGQPGKGGRGGRITAVIPTPIVKGDQVFITAGYNSGGQLFRQTATADSVKLEEVYGLMPELKNKHGGVVLVGDHLYGDSNDSGTPWCAELATGKVKWKGRGSGRGSAAITSADGRLYIRFQDGQMSLANASPEAFKEVGTFKIPHSGERPSWSHPVVTGQKMYLREGDYLLCYDLKAK